MDYDIHGYARRGDLDGVKECVLNGTGVNRQGDFGRAPLHEAAANGHLPFIEYLVSQKADIHIKDYWGKTPLHRAAAIGHLPVIEYLVSQKADIDIKDYGDRTPLHEAVANGHIPVVEYLVSQKADIDIKDIWDQTPLHMAAAKGDISTVECLLSKNADIDIKDNTGNTPLHQCVLADSPNIKTATALVKYGADFFARNKKGETPFGIAKRNKHNRIHQMFQMVEIVPDSKVLILLRANSAQEPNWPPEFFSVFTPEKNFKHWKVTPMLILRSKMSKTKELETGLPKEMRYLMNEDVDAFKNALRSGFYYSYLGKIMMVGNEGVGKTAITAILIGKKPSKTRKSTEGIDVHISRTAVDLDERKLIPKVLSVEEVAYRNLAMHKIYGKTPEAFQAVEGSFAAADDDDDEQMYLEDEYNSDTVEKQEPDQFSPDKTDPIASEPSPTKPKLSIVEKFLQRLRIKEGDKITADMLKEGTMKAGKKGILKMNLAPVIILDFAGQRVFYSTHQSFLTYRGIYVLTINGSLRLDAEMETESPIPGKYGKPTTRAYIEFWVSSILTYSKGKSKMFPKILVVCTHKDCVLSEQIKERRAYIYGEITKMFDSTPAKYHLVLDHQLFINAMDPNDPEVEVFKNALVELMFQQPSWGEKIPKPWIHLEMVINKKVQNGEMILHRKQLEEINKENPIEILGDKDLEIFLKVHHSQGDIMYFPLPGLRDHIIVHPAYLVDALKSIVTEKRFCDGRRLKMVNTMNTDGIVRKDDLKAILQAKKFMHHQGHLTNLMSHLDILAEPRTYHQDTGKLLPTDFFYVPSLVTKEDETRFTKQDNLHKKTLGLSFLFHSAVLPSAIGFRFISSIVAMFDVHSYESQRMMFSGMVVVDINTSLSMLVQVKKQRVDVFLIHETSKFHIINDIASRIRTCLEDTLYRISDSYKIASAGPDAEIETAPFHMEYACSQVESPCYTQQIESWVCDVHGEDLKIAMAKWFSDKTNDECPIDCPGVAELALEEAPNDLHLAKLVLQISCNDFIPILLRLRMTDNEIRAIQEDYKGNVLNIMFISFRKWRIKYSNETLKHLYDALKEPESQEYVHALCKVFRDKPLESTYDYLKHVEPNDEYLDRLARYAIDESLLLTVQLLNDAAYWVQLKEDVRNSVEINRKMLRKWRDDTRGKKTMRELAQACNNVGIHISLIL